jgi:hypothetical protein
MAQGSSFPRLRQRFGSTPVTQAVAYGMGLIAATDPDLGNTLSHGGGYPGYGSHMLLLTDHNVGIFVFSNRTYNGGSGAAWDAAVALHKAGALQGRPLPVSPSLAAGYRAAAMMFRAESLAPGRQMLAMNFLMDRSEENWAREFARLKDQTGECRTQSPISPTGALSGTFSWTCAKGRLDGQILLAPTRPPAIQALRFTPVPSAP